MKRVLLMLIMVTSTILLKAQSPSGNGTSVGIIYGVNKYNWFNMGLEMTNIINKNFGFYYYVNGVGDLGVTDQGVDYTSVCDRVDVHSDELYHVDKWGMMFGANYQLGAKFKRKLPLYLYVGVGYATSQVLYEKSVTYVWINSPELNEYDYYLYERNRTINFNYEFLLGYNLSKRTSTYCLSIISGYNRMQGVEALLSFGYRL